MLNAKSQKNVFSKNKKILLSFLFILLFFGTGSFVLLNWNKNNIVSTDLQAENIGINGDTYPLIVETFEKDLDIALTEPKWKALAIIFKETCDVGAVGTATLGNSRTFKGLVQSVEPIKENLNGESLIIIPCSQGAYQSSYIIALYDGKTYEPLQIPSVSEDGIINYHYSGVEVGYDPNTSIVSTSASFNGMRTCGDSAESKLIGKKLILQKFAADWDCEDQEFNEEVVYDISSETVKNIKDKDSSCALGIIGPAPDPIGGTVSLAMKESAIAGMIRRNKIFLSNDAPCIRAYQMAYNIAPEERNRIMSESDETTVADAAFFTALMPIPNVSVFREQLLRADTKWTYPEGQLFFMVSGASLGINTVTATYEDGTIVEPEPGGEWGASVHHNNGMWY